MKKRLLTLITFVIAAVFSLIAAACVDQTVQYVVTFDAGAGTAVASQTIDEGEKATEPEDPTLEGFVFAGWYKDEACSEGQEFDFAAETITADITLYAKWEEAAAQYVVTFDTGEGTAVESQTIDEGGKATEPAEPTLDGYLFMGWYKDEACSDGQEFDFAAETISANVTLYAKWAVGQNGILFEETADGTWSVSAKEGYEFEGTVEIPAEYDGKAVTEIAEYGLRSMEASEVIIPASVTNVGAFAFYGNTNVLFVDMSASSASIGEGAFEDSALVAIELGNVVSIGADAFVGSNVTFITVPASVTSIGDNALNTPSVLEVAFLGDFPALGTTVFGDGRKEVDGVSERITVYASAESWDKLIADAEGADDLEKITAVTGIEAAYIQESDMQAAAEFVGLYTGDVKVVMGVGEYAAVVSQEEVAVVETYGTGAVFTDLGDIANRKTYVLDAEKRTAAYAAPAEDGSVISGNTLYDYVGTQVVYNVPEEVTVVAPGAGVFNPNVRYVVFGDNVTEIGDYAFFNGNVFGVIFGTGIENIGDFAFGNNSYMTEIVFLGETAPKTVGAGAFCYLSETGFIPVTYMTDSYDPALIWTPLAYEDDSWWGTESEVGEFLAAFNAGLEELGDMVAKDGNGDPIRYVDQSGGMFAQLTTSGFDAADTVYEAEFGTITMIGTDTHYMLVTLNAGDYDGKGVYEGTAYAYWNYTTGDDDAGSPVRVQIMYDYASANEMRSFFAYGKFEDGKFVSRGGEYGVFGELGKEIVSIDGYGSIVYTDKDGLTYEGTYTADGEKLTVTGIPAFTEVTFTAGEGSATAIKYGDAELTALGAEAGVFYDYANRAILELDGKSFTEGDVTYSGRLTLTYNGEVVSDAVPYTLEGSSIKFDLNGVAKTWDYSRVASDYVVKGYYDESYTTQLKFIVETATELRNTYTGELGELFLDGYFNASIGKKEYTYTLFGNGTSLILFEGAECAEVLYLDIEAKSYTEASAPEAGMFYSGSSSSYRVYFDGQGNLVYFSGSYTYGTYEYDEETKEIKAWINTQNDAKNNGWLDLDKGYGYLVYDYYGDTYMPIGRQPFDASVYPSVMVYTEKDGVWSGSSTSLTVYRSGSVFFLQAYGYPFAVVEAASLTDGTTFKATLTSSSFTDLEITFTIHVDASDTLSLTAGIDYAGGTEIVAAGDTEYVFCWLNAEKTMLGIYENSAYPSSVFCDEIEWENGGKDFAAEVLDMSDGDYFAIVVTGYGTDEMQVSVKSSSSSLYDSSDGAEYKYYRINIYSDTMLWVSNSNVEGAPGPEVAEYTAEEKDGVTYYTFTSTATQMVVTFHWNGSYFTVDREVPVNA